VRSRGTPSEHGGSTDPLKMIFHRGDFRSSMKPFEAYCTHGIRLAFKNIGSTFA
jgi:hypothetical protein